MKLKNPYRLIIFAVFFFCAILLISLNLNYVKFFIENSISNYGYFAVFVFGFLADFLEQPIGPEVPASLALVFGLGFYKIFLFVLMGSYLGSILSFYIGKNFLSEDITNLCNKKYRKKYCKFFHKYGKLSLSIAAISPVPYVFFCWMAGAFNFKFFEFVIFGLIPRAFRIFGIMFLVGFFF
ncbi:MAG: VTT domain-containing protein [Nanoarchaeota archaeon]